MRRASGHREPGDRRLDVSSLVVPIQRLAVRGATPALILRELFSVVSALFPERSARLDELDSVGNARFVAGTNEADSGYEWLEFSDGAGAPGARIDGRV